MLQAKLVVIGGAKASEIPLALPTVIGRSREANLTLPHPLVSRQHCELFEQEGMLHVRDLQSLNGTYVDSQRIDNSALLKPDQLLTIGNVTFRAVYSSSGEAVPDGQSGASRVLECDPSRGGVANSDSGDTPVRGTADSRSTARGNQTPAARSPNAIPTSDLLETAEIPDSGALRKSNEQPQPSIVVALQKAGVAASPGADATISDIRAALPDQVLPAASSLDGLPAAATPAPSSCADRVEIELDQPAAESLPADDSALGSFIRRLPR
jgi:predicted component of type VI protein secretion system